MGCRSAAACLFVSVCNVWGPGERLTVTDRDVWHLTGGMSQSVTSTGQKSVFLLQIETFVGGGSSGDGPFVRCGGDESVKYRS